MIGGGIAGLTASRFAALHGLRVACFESGGIHGGLVANVERLDGYPMASSGSGTALATALVEAGRELGVTFFHERVSALEPGDGRHTIVTEVGTQHRGRRIILATGARLKRLDVPGETGLTGRGVSQCASCDGPLFRGVDVVVVGGGDSACQEALVLAALCRSVTVVTDGALDARSFYADRLAACENVVFRWDSTIDAVLGETTVEGVTVRNLKSGKVEDLAVAGVFPFVGLTPESGFVDPAVARDGAGHLLVDSSLATSVPGILAVGAVRSGYGGQIAHAVGDGTTAAASAAGASA